jgi:transcriptional regulator NrdR family protein
MVKLPDPKACPFCKKTGRVLEARVVKGYVRRRRKCSTCKHRWNSYETIVNPHDLPKNVIDTHQ